MKKIVINIVGEPGAGKSRICHDLQEKLGFEIYSPSSVLKEYAREHNITLTGRKDYVACHAALITKDKEAIIRPVLESESQYICLDGMRAPASFTELREQLNAKLINLDCPPAVRLARIQADTGRAGHRMVPSIESLLADEHPDEYNPNPYLPNMIEMRRIADYTIDASKSYDEVYSEIVRVITKIKNEQR